MLAGSVAERTREIGVRAALGVAGSLALTRYLRTLLFGVSPSDPVTFASVVLLLGFVTIAACLIPAMRAARVDPSRALRSD